MQCFFIDRTFLMTSSSSSAFFEDKHKVDKTVQRTIQPLQDEDDDSILMALEDKRPSSMVIALTFLSSISGFMFGYDTGYISSALVAIGDSFGRELTYSQEQLITAATSLGALITAILAGIVVDYLGRKPILMFSTILFIIGAVVQCASHTVWTMISGRLVMGFGVGIGSLIAPLYISELAPSRFRGRLVVINCLAITGGQLIAYAIGAGLDGIHNGWRIVVGLSMIPPAIQFVSFLFLPDTPRFLVMVGKREKAKHVLYKVYPGINEDTVEAKIASLDAANHEIPGNNPFQRYLNAVIKIHKVPSNFRALFIACSMQAIQQFTGFNSLMYFSSTIFKAVGFDNSTAVSIIVAGTNFIFTVIAFFVIDRVGRRRILLIGLPLMALFLALNAIAFHFLDISFSGDSATVKGNTHTWGVVIIVAMVLFVASYSVGIGNVPWQQSELFSQEVRGVGASYATATNWVGSLVISATFLTMLQNITPTGTFSFFAVLSALSAVLIYFCYPELTGLSLEEVQAVLTGGFNIKASENMARKRKEEHKARMAAHHNDKVVPEDERIDHI